MFLSLELCFFFVVLMAHLLRLSASTCTELEELEAVLATQELLAFESVDISKCLGNEFDKRALLISKSLPQ